MQDERIVVAASGKQEEWNERLRRRERETQWRESATINLCYISPSKEWNGTKILWTCNKFSPTGILHFCTILVCDEGLGPF